MESEVDDRKHPPSGGGSSSGRGEESKYDCIGGGGGAYVSALAAMVSMEATELAVAATVSMAVMVLARR